MFVIFFLGGLLLLGFAFSVDHNATRIMQQIYAASALGSGLMLVFAGVVDLWYHVIGRRLKRLEKLHEELPKAIAREVAKVLLTRDEQLGRWDPANPPP